ncbi:MAG: secretin N-terminal domain-containing protein [Phycisphaerales bacterium JB060]
MRMHWLACSACVVLAISVARAQELVHLPAEVELARLVDLSAERLGLRITYEPRQLAGSFMVRSGQGLEDEALWALTNELLVQKNLTTISTSNGSTGDGLTIVQLNEAGRRATPTEHWSIEETESGPRLRTPGQAGYVAILYDVQDADSQALMSAVQPLLSGGGSVTRLGDSDRVIIADLRDRVARVASLMQALDMRATVTRSYEPRVFSPGEVGNAVKRLIGEEVRVVADELTGTLLVEATASQHEAIAALVERLDAETSSARLSTRTITVRHRPVEEIVSLVNRLLGAGVAGQPDQPADAGPTTTRLPPEAPTAAERARNRDQGRSASEGVIQIDGLTVSLVADEATSRILAIGPPGVLDKVQELVRELDVRQPQVMLDVTMVSLTEGETFDLGVELEKFEIAGDIRLRLASLFGLSTSDGDGRDAGDGAGFTGVVLDPGDFAVVVRALETVNQGRSLSLPRVLVDNAATATLDAVREEPFVSTNASDTVATTSFGGSASAGTQITVTPRIAEGDHLLLEYVVSLSQFVGESSSSAVPPPRQENSITSIATIPDGHAIVLGGLETMNEGEATSQVPLLGDIPWLGELFKNRSRSSGRTKFYVFIRPTITRGDGFEYLMYVSQDLAEDLGVDDGFPVVKPRVIR